MADFGANLHRLMAQSGLTVAEVADRTGLDERTVKAIIKNEVRPRAKTLHRLASGLKASADELYQDPSLLLYRSFDRWTNPVVDDVLEERPELFQGWSEADFDELYSRFGVGGPLTREGAVESAQAMNRKRELQRKVALVLETSEGQLLGQIVEAFYQRVTTPPEDDGHSSEIYQRPG